MSAILQEVFMSMKRMKSSLNFLPNIKFLGLSKLKAFADGKVNVTKEIKIVFGRVENVVGSG